MAKNRWTYDDVYNLAQREGLWGQMSEADVRLAQDNPDTAMSVLNHKIGYRDATTDADRAYHHAAAQNDRKSAGYTGDSSGSGYYQVRRFTYDDAPSYTSKYKSQIDSLAQALLNRGPFTYNKDTDPAYAAYRKEYAREGRRASEDALGQAAALTGGMPSTAAITAAQQAGDYYASKMADKVPELYKLAYDMYMREGDEQRANVSMMQALEDMEYNQYLNQLKQYNTDRDFAYGQYSDDWNRDYQEERDKIADARYSDETSYERQMALAKLAAQYGDYSGLAGLGISPYSSVGGYAASGGGGGSSSSGGSSGGSGGSGGSGSGSGGNSGGGGTTPIVANLNNNKISNNNSKAKIVMGEELARQMQGTAYIQDKSTAKQYLMDKGINAQQAASIVQDIKSEDKWATDKAQHPKSVAAQYSDYDDYVRDLALAALDNQRESNSRARNNTGR